MTVCELVLCVCVVMGGVCGVERVAKPVVFSYSSSDLPHPATISHHYRGPVESPADQQLPPVEPSAVARDDRAQNGQRNVAGQSKGIFQSTPAYYDEQSGNGYPPHPTVSTAMYDEPRQDYDYVTVNPDHHYPPSTVAYYDDRPIGSNQHYPPPTVHKSFHSTTPDYYDDRPVDNSQYDANPSAVPPPSFNSNSQGYNFAVVNPDNSFHSTTVTYYDRSPSESYRNPPSSSPPIYNDHNHDYDIPPPVLNSCQMEIKNIIQGPHSPSSTPSPHLDYEVGSPHSNVSALNGFEPTNDFVVATTQITNRFADYPNEDQPNEVVPQFTDHSTHSPSSANYYEDNEDLISTTPIAEFESVKEKLPPIEDYPPPNRGYITKPFKHRAKRRQIHHDHHGEDHLKKKDEKYAKGGGQEHHAAHKASGGDKGDKGYKSSHKFSKGKKGHHDKEDHKGKYLDEKGKKGKKEEEGGHYGEHHRGEGGKKVAKYGESGEHKKGHSTKGEHNIHKMDEYLKKHEFYDEHHEGGDHEKFGGFVEAHAGKRGGKKKKGHHKSGSSHHHKGKKGHHEKGEKKDHHKGHKDAKGYDGHFAHHKKYGKKGGHKEGKNGASARATQSDELPGRFLR
ncbi:hypothetical protein GE061_001339 [Apolygus lucorum]|uniref:Uncharacterized protein n=1 Tax=Apolygus lucorum TaxID=248454 RepID=A0A8S9Y9R2_APOLU|nr:hypothetical protein GE061_001339 [Apolygus lucorum]